MSADIVSYEEYIKLSAEERMVQMACLELAQACGPLASIGFCRHREDPFEDQAAVLATDGQRDNFQRWRRKARLDNKVTQMKGACRQQVSLTRIRGLPPTSRSLGSQSPRQNSKAVI